MLSCAADSEGDGGDAAPSVEPLRESVLEMNGLALPAGPGPTRADLSRGRVAYRS